MAGPVVRQLLRLARAGRVQRRLALRGEVHPGLPYRSHPPRGPQL